MQTVTPRSAASDLDLHCLPRSQKWDARLIIEPPHDKINKVACAPSEDSDQPGHPPSPIRVFAVRMKKAWVLSCLLSAQRRIVRGSISGMSSTFIFYFLEFFLHLVYEVWKGRVS